MWSVLLSDSIIFQNKHRLKKPPTINISQFLKPQVEKSFNREQKPETKNELLIELALFC